MRPAGNAIHLSNLAVFPLACLSRISPDPGFMVFLKTFTWLGRRNQPWHNCWWPSSPTLHEAKSTMVILQRISPARIHALTRRTMIAKGCMRRVARVSILVACSGCKEWRFTCPPDSRLEDAKLVAVQASGCGSVADPSVEKLWTIKKP